VGYHFHTYTTHYYKIVIKTCISVTNEITGGWKKLHNEDTHNLYSSPNIIRTIKTRKARWAGHVTRMEKRNVCKILVGKAEGKRPLGRLRCRWENNTKMDLRETKWGSMEWIHLAQDRDQWTALVNTVMHAEVP
jgi:hypothetical protein